MTSNPTYSLDSPDHTFIDWLHRGHDAGISFHHKPDGVHFKDIGGLRAVELDSHAGEVLSSMQGDCYFSINGFPAKKKGRRQLSTELHVDRKAENVEWLTSLYVDMDLHKGGISVPDAEREIFTLSKEELIPEPSAILYSGRGLWAFWRLSGDGGFPVKASNSTTHLFHAAQRLLLERLAHLEGDPQSKDVSRITRIPGTVNLKSGERVGFRLIDEEASYTLPEIVDFLRSSNKSWSNLILPAPSKSTPKNEPDFTLPDSETNSVRRNTSLAGVVPKGLGGPLHERAKKGERALSKYRWQQLNTLHKIRKGFREGCRSHAIMYYGVFLRNGTNRSHDEIRDFARQLGARCIPPLPEIECDNASKWGIKAKRIPKDDTISDALGITPEEEALLALELPLLPSTWKRAAKYYPGGVRPEIVEPLTREEKHEARITHLQGLREAKGLDYFNAISAGEAGKYLEAQGMKRPHDNTVKKALLALGWPNPRSRENKAKSK